ncbi:MAG: radical SAM protein [Methylobacter sp.]|nr:MAG: radical SAM protein [Methylobacter sp.]
MEKPLIYKGRGSISNADGRFEKQQHEAFDDGWSSLDEDLPPLATEVITDTSKSLITYNESPDIPFDRSANPYRGCEHGCVYCFARPSHAYLGLSPGLDFETKILIKPDAAAILRNELGKRSYRCATLALGTNTDPYQPLERQHRIMRQILEVLYECRHPVNIVTKSSLIERDIDLLAAMAEQGLASVFISITTLDQHLARALEPRAASPKRRLESLEKLSLVKIPTGVLVAPIIPMLNDHELEAIIKTVKAAGAQSAGYVLLRLPLEVAELFEQWLKQFYPLKAGHIMNLIKDCRGGNHYDSSFFQRQKGTGNYADMLAQRFRLAAKKSGLDKPLPPLNTAVFRRPDTSGQMRFDCFD